MYVMNCKNNLILIWFKLLFIVKSASVGTTVTSDSSNLAKRFSPNLAHTCTVVNHYQKLCCNDIFLGERSM